MSIQLTHRLNELAISYEAKGQDADLHIAETLHRAIALINSLEREVARPSFQPIDYSLVETKESPFDGDVYIVQDANKPFLYAFLVHFDGSGWADMSNNPVEIDGTDFMRIDRFAEFESVPELPPQCEER